MLVWLGVGCADIFPCPLLLIVSGSAYAITHAAYDVLGQMPMSYKACSHHLRLSDVRYPEHELQDAISPCHHC